MVTDMGKRMHSPYKQKGGNNMNEENLMKKYGLKGNPKIGLALATLGFFVGFSAVSLFGSVATQFSKMLGLSGVLLGFLVGAPQLFGSLLRIPFGAWVDKAGGRKPLIILLSISIVGMLGLTTIIYTGNLTLKMFPLVVFFGLLGGCGVATFSVGSTQTSYWFPSNKQGVALGAYGGLGNTAPGLFGIILPLVLGAFGLAGTYTMWLIFLVFGTIIYAIFSNDSYYFQLKNKGLSDLDARRISGQLGQELFPTGTVSEALKIAAKVPGTWTLIALYFTSFGGFLALTSWFPTYWVQLHGTSVRTAGLLMALGFSLLASLLRVYGGRLADKFGGEKVAVMSFAMILVGALLLMVTTSFGLALIGEVIMGAGMGFANGAVFKLVPTYVSKAPGGAMGLVGGLGAFGGFVVPPLMGMFVDAFGKNGFSRGFILYVILAVISIVISFILMRKNNQSVVTEQKILA
jgi:NNP family nitrate/nitrite transporter-like MFS transporter